MNYDNYYKNGGMTKEESVSAIALRIGAKKEAVAKFVEKHKIDTNKLNSDLKSGEVYFMDVITAIVGKPDNEYEKQIVKKYGTKMAMGGKTQGYDDREDERLGMEYGKMSGKDFDGSHDMREHSRRDDARFEERMARGGEVKKGDVVKIQGKDFKVVNKFDSRGTKKYFLVSTDDTMDKYGFLNAMTLTEKELAVNTQMANGGMMARGGKIDEKEKLSNISYQLINTTDSFKKNNPEAYSKMRDEYKAQFIKVYGKDEYAKRHMMADGGMMADGNSVDGFSVGDRVIYKNGEYPFTIVELVDDENLPYAKIKNYNGKIKKAYLTDLTKVKLMVAKEYVNPELMNKMREGKMADSGETERKAEAIKTAVEIATMAYNNGVRAYDMDFEDFSYRIFSLSKTSYPIVDLRLAYNALLKAGYKNGGMMADGGELEAKKRLEELREVLRSEDMSYGELVELQSLAKYIEKDDVELLEAAGVPEFDDDENENDEEAKAKQRLEELREELRSETISYSELFELQSLVDYIDKDDVELLEAAGVPEFDDDEFKHGGMMADGGEIGQELMGGQPNQEKPSGAILLEVRKKGKEIVVTEDNGETKELYVKSNGFSGYTLHYKGNQYEFAHSLDSYAKGGETKNKWEYTDKDEIEYVVVKDKYGEELKFDGKDVISGVHDLLEKGGKLTEIGKYYSKNDVVSVFVNGKNILDKNTVSGVWIKKDAEPNKDKFNKDEFNEGIVTDLYENVNGKKIRTQNQRSIKEAIESANENSKYYKGYAEVYIGAIYVGSSRNGVFKYSSKYKGNKYDQDGMKADAGFVVVSENDGYWYIMSKPTSKQDAEEFLSTLTIPRGEVGKVVSVEDAKNHKKVIGRKYLKMADGGVMSDERDKDGMLYALQEHISSGEIANITNALKYTDIDEIRTKAIQYYLENGDKPYSYAELESVLNKFDHTKMADGGMLTKSNLESIKNKYEENEDENYHGENVILLAKNFGSAEDLSEAKRILNLHKKEGNLSSENGKIRQELHMKLIGKARAEMKKEGIKFDKGGQISKDYKNWDMKNGEVTYKGKLVTRYDFDRDADAFFIDAVSGGGQKGFREKMDVYEYLSENVNLSKFAKGGMMADGGMMARGGYVTDLDEVIASSDLKEELKSKMKEGDKIVAFAYTDYGGSFGDKVAIEYFKENHPKNIVFENSAYNGQNGIVFGEVAKDFLEETEDYPLGYEDMESFYYDMQNAQEEKDFKLFLSDIKNKYTIKKDALDWLLENKSGYYSIEPNMVDFSYSELENELEEEGLIKKKKMADGGMMAKGGKITRNKNKNDYNSMFNFFIENNYQPIGKRDLIEMAYASSNGVDSAIPQSMVGDVDNTAFYVYDYQTDKMGELVDLRMKLKFSNVKVDVTIVQNGELKYGRHLPYELENATFHQALNYVFTHDDVEQFNIRPRKKFELGGAIENQYEGRTPEDIWNNLTKTQRTNFLFDHKKIIEIYRHQELSNLDIKDAVNTDWDGLDELLKNEFEYHTSRGQYAKGGMMADGGEIKVINLSDDDKLNYFIKKQELVEKQDPEDDDYTFIYDMLTTTYNGKKFYSLGYDAFNKGRVFSLEEAKKNAKIITDSQLGQKWDVIIKEVGGAFGEQDFTKKQYVVMTSPLFPREMLREMRDTLKYAKGGMMADGGAIKGSNPSTGEKFGVVIGSFEKNDDGLTTLTIRSGYSSRIKSYELTFDERGFLRSIGDFGHTIDGTYPDMKGGHLSVKNVNADNKKESIDALAQITSPSFAKKVYEYVHEEKMAKGGYMKMRGNYFSYHGRMLNDVLQYMLSDDFPSVDYQIDYQDSNGQRLYADKKDLIKIENYLMNNFGVTEIEQGQNTGYPLGGYTHYLYLKNIMINRYKDKMADGGMMADGGKVSYREAGENYEYVNTFGIEQRDFEKIVDAYHKSPSSDQIDRIDSRMTFNEMRTKYGREKVDEVGNYIHKTHQSHGKMAKGGKTDNIDYSKQTTDDFTLGEIVYDVDNKRYGTVIGIYDDDGFASSKFELRLDSDGVQPTENLRKVGDKGDKGTKKQLDEAITQYARLVKLYGKDNDYPKQIKPEDSKDDDKPKNKWEYTDKDEIEYVVVKDKSGKELKFDGKYVISGVHDLLEKGGKLTEIGKYYSKNDVVSVFVNGKNILDKNTVSGVWIQKDAKPMAEDVAEMKIGKTTIRKGANGWVAKTFVDNFKGFDWEITTIKNYKGDLTTTAQGGKSEDRGGYQTFSFAIFGDPSIRLKTSRPARVTDKIVSEQHTEAMKDWKERQDEISEKVDQIQGKKKMADGGAIGFDALAKKVAKNYEGDKVKKEFQDEYGKTYDKKEAEEVGKKVAGKVYRQQQAKGKMAKGGKVDKKNGTPANRSQSKMTLISRKASEIRKANEPWRDAFNRAKAMLYS